MIIFITFKWKKVLGKCCLTILGGITRLITQTQTSLVGCFGTNFAILKYVILSGLETGSV